MRPVAMLLAATILVACGSDPTTPPPADARAQVCIPGAQVACACLGGAQGIQVCSPSGTEVSTCLCPDAVAPEDAVGLDVALDAPAPDVAPDAPPSCPSMTVSNCCGVACTVPTAASSAACTMGRCAVGTCNAGFGDCDGNVANGCEVDTRASNANCGMCGAPCAAGRGCVMGACVPCDADGDGVMATACGGMDCDDTNNEVRPGAIEYCDGFDNDCNRSDDMADVALFADPCQALLDRAFPGRTWNPARAACSTMIGTLPSGVRATMACRRCFTQGSSVQCTCISHNGTNWSC